MKKILTLFLISLIGVTPSVSALEADNFNARTTRDLVTLCSAGDDDAMYDVAMGYCLGFVQSAISYHRIITSGDLLKPIACPHHTATQQEVIDVFLGWAGSNDSLLDGEAPLHGLMRAVSAKWPCD